MSGVLRGQDFVLAKTCGIPLGEAGCANGETEAPRALRCLLSPRAHYPCQAPTSQTTSKTITCARHSSKTKQPQNRYTLPSARQSARYPCNERGHPVIGTSGHPPALPPAPTRPPPLPPLPPLRSLPGRHPAGNTPQKQITHLSLFTSPCLCLCLSQYLPLSLPLSLCLSIYI